MQQQKVRNAEEEVAGCTFAPQVSPRPPRYIERIARSHSARVAAGLVYDEGAAVTSRWK